jgi:hypothetical protein
MITASMQVVKSATEARYDAWFDSGRLRQWGVYNRRYIAGTRTWSQHAWGNAWDIGIPRMADGDVLYSWLLQQRRVGALPIGTILWRVPDHFDHIHVEGTPKQTGTPPRLDKDEESMKELTANIQKALNAAGAKDKNGQSLKVDGVWGPLTESAFVNGLMLGAGGIAPGTQITITGKIS